MTNLERFAEIVLASPAGAARLGFHLLDTLGAWLAGTRTEDCRLIAALAAPQPGFAASGENPLDRIAQRVAIVRNTEIDDIHMQSCTTIGSVVVPVAITVAGVLGKADAECFAAALAAGYEAMARLSLAISGATVLYRGVWPTFFSAPVGAAATAAPLLGLGAAQTADALAMALALTSGAAGGHAESSPRWILLGQAARAGAFAALAAAKGYRGDRSLLDGDWLRRSHGITLDAAPLLAPLEGEGALATVSYKPFCAAKQNTAAIDGFRQLLARVPAEAIEAVRVTVPPAYARMIGHCNAAKGRIERITSTAYQLALAAYRPDLLDDVTRPDMTQDAKIAAFVPKVEVAADAALASYFPAAYPARVEARLASGETAAVLVTDAAGDPARSLREAELRAKFNRLAEPVIGKASAENLAAAALAAPRDDQALASLLAAIERTKTLDLK